MNTDREHLAYADENGEPEGCIEDCPGCHWEGNTECEALASGCDICDPDGTLDDEWQADEQPPIEVGTPVIGETTDGRPIRLAVTAVADDGTITVGVVNSEKPPEARKP